MSSDKRYAIIPAALVVPPTSDAAVRLCAYFWNLCDENGAVEILQPTLQKAMGWGRRKTLDAIKELTQSGIIAVRRTRGASIYKVTWFEDAVASLKGIATAKPFLGPTSSGGTLAEVRALAKHVEVLTQRVQSLTGEKPADAEAAPATSAVVVVALKERKSCAEKPAKTPGKKPKKA